MNGRWRKLADKKASAYREMTAYLDGVQAGARAKEAAECSAAPGHAEDARAKEAAECCAAPGHAEDVRVKEAALWIQAVDATRRELKKQSPARAAFFADYYGLDVPRRRQSVTNRLWMLSEKYHMTEDALKTWRRGALDLLILAATQLGLLRPFAGCEEPGGEPSA